MSYLIAINDKTGDILHPEILKLSDSFSVLTKEEMLCVVLYADYSSLFSQHPEQERKRRAMLKAFGKEIKDMFDLPRMQIAIKEYNDIQFDPDRELIRKIQSKIDDLLQKFDENLSVKDINDLTKTISSLKENIVSLQEKVMEKQRADGVIQGDRQLSFIEKTITNKPLYRSIVKKK